MEKRIVVIQRRMTHYRVAFFNRLRHELAGNGVELILAYGRSSKEEEKKDDAADIDWGHRLPTVYLANGAICYQPLKGVCDNVDMLVITHENKLVCNLWHQFAARKYKIGLWGHGANLQGDPSTIRERVKRRTAERADWWFGYTAMSVPLIVRSGFPEERITVLNNSVDTSAFKESLDSVSADSVENLKARLRLRGKCVGIFIGSLYEDKRIEFLLDAAKLIREQRSDFELLILGDGPKRELVQSFCSGHDWAKYIGAAKHLEKAEALRAAHVMLNPGLVGLGILDSFIARVPMITTDCGLHSPEISYLKDGFNGMVAPNALEPFVNAAVTVLTRLEVRTGLQRGCDTSARQYSVENMAANFTDGVIKCLEMPGRR